MCGLVGAVGNLGTPDEKIFRELLIVDVIRGSHSTGVTVCNIKGEVGIFKKPIEPIDFMDLKGFKDVMKGSNVALMGHNRYATKGRISANNAHPFNHGKITGMHNGTLKGQHLLPDSNLFEVDSENIIHSLNKLGTSETFSKLDGAYALTWIDADEQELYIIRNKERPLWYTLSEDKRCMFYASEPWMLRGIFLRNNISVGEVLEFEEDKLYTYNLKTAKGGLEKPRVRSLKGYIAPPYVPYTHSRTVPSDSWYDSSKRTPTPNPQRGPLQEIFHNGSKWKVGERVAFRIDKVTRLVSENARVTGICCDNIHQHVTMYIHSSHSMRDKVVEGSVREFTGEIVNLMMSADNKHELTVLLNPVTLRDSGGFGGKKKEEFKLLDFHGRSINSKKFLKLTRKGCAWCTDTVKESDAESIIWIAHDEFVCGDCAATDDVRSYIDETAYINQSTSNRTH